MPSPAGSARSTPSFTYDPQPEEDSENEFAMFTAAPIGVGLYTKYSKWTGEGLPQPKRLTWAERRKKEADEAEAEKIKERIAMGADPDGSFSNCPPMTGKMRNQYMARKTVEEALADCGDDEALKKCVIAATESEEYKAGKAVPADLLAALCEISGARSHSKCRFPNCNKLNVRTDRAKEHARAHIGNHPYPCTKIQANDTIGCGVTFLRKHDRNRHNAGAEVLTCEDCGASIQGKGREYNLQRHKTNYCQVRKALKQREQVEKAGTNTSTEPGTIPTTGPPGGSASSVTSTVLRASPALASAPMPATMQVHGPVTASTALPMNGSIGVVPGVEV